MATSQPSERFRNAYPDALRDYEERLLGCSPHRTKYNTESLLPRASAKTGFALSGGGIRSATFALGIFQALARLGQIRKIDVLSTVSGGGYFGSFLGALYARDYISSAEDVEWLLNPDAGAAAPKQDDVLHAARANVVAWLRENGRYLAPRGGGDVLLGVAVMLRNWAAVIVTLAALLLGVLLAAQLPRVVSPGEVTQPLLAQFPAQEDIFWSPWAAVALTVLALAAAIGWAYWLVGSQYEVRSQLHSILWWIALLVIVGYAPSDRLLMVQVVSALAAVCCLLSLFSHPLSGVPTALAIGLIATRVPSEAPLMAPVRTVAITLGGLGLGAVTLVFAAWAVSASYDVTRSALRRIPIRIFEERRQPYPNRSLLTRFLQSTHLWWAVRRVQVFVQELKRAHREDRDRRRQKAIELHRVLDVQHLLSVWLKAALVIAALMAGWGALDTAAQTIYGIWSATIVQTRTPILASAGSLVGLGLFWKIVKGVADKDIYSTLLRVPRWVYVAVIAIVVASVLLIELDLVAYAIVWKFHAVSGVARFRHSLPGAADKLTTPILTIITTAVLTLAFAFGRTFSFLNRSSHHPLYTARLVRAYLGASNERRWLSGIEPVITTVEGDDLREDEYWPGAQVERGKSSYEKGAPLHLINVTINETIDGQTQLQQQDRKGVGMALGPGGVSVGVRHHVAFGEPSQHGRQMTKVYPEIECIDGRGTAYGGDNREYRVFEYDEASWLFPAEPLTIGAWVGISGAAFSTGLGSRTSISLSTLAGLTNVRLGYWWDSRVMAHRRRQKTKSTPFNFLLKLAAKFFPAQTYLIDEILARFPGTSRKHWYLSDGGHFENMGGYELIRRRLPFMVIVDAEADPKYEFEGLANLVRKARVDFGAELHFFTEQDLHKLRREISDVAGSLEAFRPSKQTRRKIPRCAIARVTYADEPSVERWLVYIKPTIAGDEPADVQEYANRHRPFPQQTTIDQFFDEAQWESYRRLGEHIGNKVFTAIGSLDNPQLTPPAKGAVMP